ncbi:hypothetical protein IL306_004264 [Fusarium sp. DS 682]|nr:hypothetical protein IL306_004264 [Fusarium sp. DS 682]
MPRPRTDEEIQASWGPLQWQFKEWQDSQKENIPNCAKPGTPLNAFNKLFEKSFPKKEDRLAYHTWASEWLGRSINRMAYQTTPSDFIQQVKATNFTNNKSTGDLLYSVLVNDMPWVPIGRSNYGGVRTYYAFKPTTKFLQPDRKEGGLGVVGNYILTMPLKPKSRSASGLSISSSSSAMSTAVSEAGSTRACASTIQGSAKQSSSDDDYLVFAQIGALYVFGGDYDTASKKGPWWRNGFAVVVELNNKGEAGEVYVVYNDALVKEKKAYDEAAVDLEEIADSARVDRQISWG